MNKKGITISMLVVVIIVTVILTVTITFSAGTTISNSKLRAFATEIAYVQNTYRTYIKNSVINDMALNDITVNVSGLSTSELAQFAEEDIVSNKMILHVLNLDKLGISNTAFGNGETEKDYYVFSSKTNKVYYIKGYESSGAIYYAYTDELVELINGGAEVSSEASMILFEPSTTDYTNEAIWITIKIPVSITSYEITPLYSGEINVTEGNIKDGYREIYVNNETKHANYYHVGVKTNGNQISYYARNFDNIKPTISVGAQTTITTSKGEKMIVLSGIKATDNIKIKTLKYEKTKIDSSIAQKYFGEYGTEFIGDKIIIEPNTTKYTIYAEDVAGNFVTYVVDVDSSAISN